MLLICTIFLIKSRIVQTILSSITAVFLVLGMCIISNQKDIPLAEFIGTQKTFVITTIINLLVGAYAVYKLVSFGEYEVLKAWNDKKAIENDIELILSNLEEAIITKSEKD